MAQDLVINGKRFEDVKQLAAKNVNGETVIYSESEGGGSGLLQIKTVQPGKEQQIVKPDTGYYGLESVTVSGDKNLSAENIKFGVNIFGVTGEHEGGSGSGDMETTTYDPNGVVAESGGIEEYVSDVVGDIDTILNAVNGEMTSSIDNALDEINGEVV